MATGYFVMIGQSCVYRVADTVGDNPRNNLFIHGLTIAGRGLHSAIQTQV